MISTSNSHGNLRHIVMTIGLFLVGISLYCSFLLYTSFSPNLSDKAAWGGMGLGLDMFKNIALLAAFALWTLGFFAARIISVVVFIAYALLSVLSFMAFFGFMSTVQSKVEQGNLITNNRYMAAQAAVDSANRKVDDLSKYADVSIQEQRLQAVREEKLQHLATIDTFLKGEAGNYMNADCSAKKDRRGSSFTTLAAQYCADPAFANAKSALDTLRAEEIALGLAITGHAQYIASLSHRERTLGELGDIEAGGSASVNNSTIHPMFVDLGKLVNSAPDEMKVMFMFVSSAAAEILGTLSVLIAWMLGRKRSFTLDEIEHMHEALREQQHRLQTALGQVSHQPASLTGYGASQLPVQQQTLPGYKVKILPTETEGVYREQSEKEEPKRITLDQPVDRPIQRDPEPVAEAKPAQPVYDAVARQAVIVSEQPMRLGDEIEYNGALYYLVKILDETDELLVMQFTDGKIHFNRINRDADYTLTGKGLPEGQNLINVKFDKPVALDFVKDFWGQSTETPNGGVVPCQHCGTTFTRKNGMTNCTTACRIAKAKATAKAKA